MKITLLTAVTLLLALTVQAAEPQKLYRWVDSNGTVHYGDKVPPEYAEMDKHVVNEHGITVDTVRGKKSPEELAEERRLKELRAEEELQRRADRALLATYNSIDEIVMHRDRRVELFQAQSRVTELYLRNLQRRLDSLLQEASGFQPYSDDEDAPMIDPSLSEDLAVTRETIARHEDNLKRFQMDEAQIVQRFETEMDRFRKLKGLDQQASAQQPPSGGA
jgi:hypothetical protein